MTIYICTTNKDLSRESFCSAAEKRNVPCNILFYDTLSILNGRLAHESRPLQIAPEDRIILRWPWDAENTEVEYNVLLQAMLQQYGEQVLYDTTCLRQYSPFYEDKLFQNLQFNRMSIPTPVTYYAQTILELQSLLPGFPVIQKKRISSRSLGNYVVRSVEELQKNLRDTTVKDMIFQEYLDLAADYRILIFKNTILGTVGRTVRVNEEQKVRVKVADQITNMKPEILETAKRAAAAFGADFAGVDVITDTSGNWYLVEVNLSPQFSAFERITGIDVAGIIIEDAMSQS
jgi:hypothetical protein